MGRRSDVAILVSTLLVFWVSPCCVLAQTQKPFSLEEQLRAQYQAATVLTVQKEGILAVVSTSSKTCAAKYQDGKLIPPDVSCTAPLKNSSRPMTMGEKVNPSKIDVDLAKETISFQIVDCDSCNKGSQSAFYQSQIDFQFGKGHLENASISQVEDTIAEVLVFDEGGGDQQPPQAQDSQAVQGQQNEAPVEVLTNGGVEKMTEAKLGDGVIVSKIKTSTCNFNTRTDAILELKAKSVSEPVIQAMLETKVAPTPAVNDAPSNDAPAPGPNDPNAVHDPGIYIYTENASDKKMILLEPTQYTQKASRLSGWPVPGIPYGIPIAKPNGGKAEVSNPQAIIRISDANVAFYFYLEKGSNLSYGSVSSPNEFALLRLKVKNKSRETNGNLANMFGSSSGTDKSTVSFTSVKIRPGVHKVMPNAPLTPGEYAFLSEKEMTTPANRLFDFGVDPPK
jgi:hypothetical protein